MRDYWSFVAVCYSSWDREECGQFPEAGLEILPTTECTAAPSNRRLSLHAISLWRGTYPVTRIIPRLESIQL
jgi:hypothetical protein